MDELVDDAIADLPDDPEFAFVVYERRLRAKFGNQLSPDQVGGAEGIRAKRSYANQLLAFVHEYDIKLDVPNAIPGDHDRFVSWYFVLMTQVEYLCSRLKLRAAKRNVEFSIPIEKSFRELIGEQIQKIRMIVEAASLTTNKKDAIFGRLTALQVEVDKERTRFEAFLAKYLDVAGALGDSADRLDPAIKQLEKVMAIFGKAREENKKSLPADQPPARLPPPRED